MEELEIDFLLDEETNDIFIEVNGILYQLTESSQLTFYKVLNEKFKGKDPLYYAKPTQLQ